MRRPAVQPAHTIFGAEAISNSYVIWRNPDNPDAISKVGKVKHYGFHPRCHHPLLELFWVAERDTVIEPWRLVCTTAPQMPTAQATSISQSSGQGVNWSKPLQIFGPAQGLLRVPLTTNATIMTGQHHVVVSKSSGDNNWRGEDLFQHQLVEYHLTLEDEPLLVLQPLPQVYHDTERWSLAIVSDVVEHCPLNAWYEGVPYHTHRLTR